MFIVLVLAGLFVAGLVTLAVFLWRVLTIRWAAEQTPRVEPGGPYVSPRSKELTLLEREIRQAAADGKLTAPTELELLSHLQAERRTLGERGAAGKAEAMPRKEERDHPIPESIPSPAEPAVPAPEAFKAEVVPEAPPRDVRAAIERLHHDAEEAKALAGIPEPPRERTEVTPEPEPVPLSAPPRVELSKKAAAPLPPPKPKIPWTVRLFTPENVRILQSLGIAIVFFSAVAYVRTSMWEAASAFSRMSLLLSGTAACLAMGYALRRWTFLRLTGLAFVLLGHLAFALDAYAALLGSGPGQLPLWPFAPSALWFLTLSVFALSSAWHARKLDEPLFNAFALFGGLGAWGMALRWMSVPWTLLPAAFSPVLFALLLAIRFLAVPGAAARWSLRWWCEVAWRNGARLGVLLLPVAACLSPQAELARHLPWHLAALGLVSGGLAWPRRGEEGAGDAAWACLGVALMAPLAAWALRWSAEWWTAVLALPGAVMAWSGLLAGVFAPAALRRRWEAARDAGLCLLGMGLVLGFVWSTPTDPTPLLLSVAAAWTVAWGCMWRRGDWLAPWAAALLGAWGFKLLAQFCGWGPETWALGWLLLASLPLVLWNRLPEQDARARHGATSSDALALVAALWMGFALLDSTSPATLHWSLGWLGCAGYAAVTARLSRSAWRVGAAVALLSPMLASLHEYFGTSGYGQAWTFSLLAAAAALGSRRWARGLLDAEAVWHAALAGACVPLLHAAVLALGASAAKEYVAAAWAWGGVGLACGAFAWRLRLEQAQLELAETFEFLALLGLNAAGASLALQVWGELAWRPAVFLALTAATTFLALWGEYLGAAVRREQPAYRRAGASVSLLLTGAALLLVVADWPHAGASQLWASPIGLGWVVALTPGFLAWRERERHRYGALYLVSAFLAGAGLLCSAIAACASQYWIAGTPVESRQQAMLFAGLLAGGAWFALRRMLQPTAIYALGLGALGLLGGVYGAWPVPAESAGLAFMALAWGLSFVPGLFVPENMRTRTQIHACFAAVVLASCASLHLFRGLCQWPTGAMHAWGMGGWLLLAGWLAWQADAGKRAMAGSFAAACAVWLALTQGLRMAGLEPHSFGPPWAVYALLIFGVRQLCLGQDGADGKDAPWRLRAQGLAPFEWLVACASLAAGLGGWMFGAVDTWSLTLALNAGFLALWSGNVRKREPNGVLRACCGELAAWFLGACALAAFSHSTPGFIPLQGLAWLPVAAVALALGMAGEAIAGAWLGPQTPARSPSAWLESRLAAAVALGGWGTLQVLCSDGAWNGAGQDATWRALLALSLLAIYGSFARWSLREAWCEAGRTCSALAAYVFLLPSAYLALLKAHSSGSGWGGPCFLALAPMLLLASALLRREGRAVPAALARGGALWVALGALVLTYAGNPAHAPEVAAASWAGLAALAWWGLTGGWKKARTLAAYASAGLAVLYLARAWAGLPAWGAAEAPAHEAVLFALWGLLGIASGLGLRNRDRSGGERLAQAGIWLGWSALPWAVLMLAIFGAAAGPYPDARVDALIACLMLNAGAALLGNRLGGPRGIGWQAPAFALSGYGLYAWLHQAGAWEWYTLPAAAAAFLWCIERDRTEPASGDDTEMQAALWGAGLLATAPSFLQALPYAGTALPHYFLLLILGFALVGGAMWSRRRVPLLVGSASILTITLIKAIQWAAHREVVLPVVGIAIGFAILAVGCLFESRMNLALKRAVDRARAEARMFWVSWR